MGTEAIFRAHDIEAIACIYITKSRDTIKIYIFEKENWGNVFASNNGYRISGSFL